MVFGALDEKMNYPAYKAFVIAPDNVNDLDHVTRAIYVGGYGDLRVTTIGDDVVTFVGLAAGLLHAIRVKRVWVAGTTATNIVGLY